ncbi:ABC transporter permease [Scrofimicrobium sp. R131]|uniref:ABC transporter permease subunit n=1 Tax=Scrofimicrobium appendicitidis TaxID=3079930 RepID=A0AAU7V9Q1_9ACTO
MWQWLVDNSARVTQLGALHLLLAVSATVIGLVVAIGAGALTAHHHRLATFGVVLSGIIFTIPSLTLFIFIPLVLGTKILNPINIVIALSIYAFALIYGGVVEALRGVNPETRQAAEAMGIGPARLFWTVELPLAIPVLAATTRVAAVSSVSLVSVGALIGVGGLGDLFTEGFQRAYPVPILWGIILSMALALAVDLAIVGIERLATPWLREAR